MREVYFASRIVSSQGHDIKLVADLESEKRVVEVLRRETEFPILSEEGGWISDSGRTPSDLLQGETPVWVVDPLDGSFNFHRGLPMAAVSIALWRSGRPVLGVIADVFRDEVFAGGENLGMRVNDREVSVSQIDKVSDAALCTGLPVGGSFSVEALTQAVHDMSNFKKVRYLGSAALSLAYVASGRADVYKENGIRLWDVAAGLALVVGAGGKVEFQPHATDVTLLSVHASNGRLS